MSAGDGKPTRRTHENITLPILFLTVVQNGSQTRSGGLLCLIYPLTTMGRLELSSVMLDLLKCLRSCFSTKNQYQIVFILKLKCWFTSEKRGKSAKLTSVEKQLCFYGLCFKHKMGFTVLF